MIFANKKLQWLGRRREPCRAFLFQWDGTSLDTDLDKEGAVTTLRTSMTLPVELLSEVALLGRLKAEGPGNQTSAAQACPGAFSTLERQF